VILRERVTADQQAAEIRQTWPSTSDHPTESSQIRLRLICAHSRLPVAFSVLLA
jgi:hypothetical protein